MAEPVAGTILEHRGLPSQVPPLGRAIGEPQGELWPPDEISQPPVPEEFDQPWSTIDFAE